MAIQTTIPANQQELEDAESEDDISYREAKNKPGGMTDDDRIYFAANGYEV